MSSRRKLQRKAVLKGRGGQLQQATQALQTSLQALQSGGLEQLPSLMAGMVAQTNRAAALADAIVDDYEALVRRLDSLEERMDSLEKR